MKIAIMGAGGLGGYFGGLLAQAGHDVSFIARGAQLQAMQQTGLQVKRAQAEFRLQPVQATDAPADVGPVELLLFCVKAYDALIAAQMMEPMVGEGTSIVPILNGIEHMDILTDLYGAKHVLGGQTSMTAHVLAPGSVERVGTHGTFDFGEIGGGSTTRTEALAEVLGIDGINAKAVPNIMHSMWQKFAMICGVNLFAVIRGDAETMRRAPETFAMILQGIREGVAVAQAKGIPLDESALEFAQGVLNGLPPHFKPSLLVSLDRGQRIEVEALNGAMSRMGKEVGVPTPINDCIYTCLKPYVNGP